MPKKIDKMFEKHFDKHSRTDEVVQWTCREKEMIFHPIYLLPIGLLILSVVLLVKGIGGAGPVYLFIVSMVLFSVLGILFNNGGKRIYALSNKRIIIFNGHEKWQYFDYKSIKKIAKLGFKNEPNFHFFGRESELVFEKIPHYKFKEAHSIVLENIRESGVFKNTTFKLEKYEDSFNLEMEKVGTKTSLIGKVEGFPFLLEIEGIVPMKSLRIEFKEIPNPQNNSFRIRHERIINPIHKAQAVDLEIDDERTDDDYVIESDNLYFLKIILTKDVRANLNKKQNKYPELIEFGSYKKETKQKAIKTKFKADDAILDAHLLEGTPSNEIETDPDLKSSLHLQFKPKAENQDKTFARELDDFFELAKQLVLEIKKYNQEVI